MLGLQDLSITKKLTWMNMSVSGAALFLACAAFISFDVISFRETRQLNLSIRAQIIGSNSTSALAFNDPQSAENTLAALKADPHVISAGVYTKDGKLFAGYLRGQSGQALPVQIPVEDRTNFDWLRRGQITAVQTIHLNGKLMGAVYVLSDLEDFNARLKRFGTIVILILITSMTAAFLLSSVSRKTIAQPIVQLADVARIVTREKRYSVRANPTRNHDEMSDLIAAFNEMLGQIKERDDELQKARDELEQRVQQRTVELTAVNKELEAFSYSVSHDLRAPLRSIDGFSQALLEDYNDKLDASGKDFLQRVRASTQRMAQLIDDIIELSRVTRAEVRPESVNLSDIAKVLADELRASEPGRQVEVAIAENLITQGDERLLRVAMENLIRNAWKFTSKRPAARIEVGTTGRENGRVVYFVRDDGAGFEMDHAQKLFSPFQRLHSMAEFKGTGVGLATVQRIIHRHGGRIWAEAQVNKGASFYFTL